MLRSGGWRMEDGMESRLNVFSTADSRMQQRRLSAVLNAPRSRSATSPKKFDFPFFNRHLYILWCETKSEKREKQKRRSPSERQTITSCIFFCVCVITGLKTHNLLHPHLSSLSCLSSPPPPSFLCSVMHLNISSFPLPTSLLLFFQKKKKAAHF